MEKIKLIALFLAIPLLVLGQDSKTQEIEVIGVGKITTQADFAILSVSVSSDNEDRSLLIKKLNDDSEVLRKDLLDYGFTKEQVTVTDFKINDNNDYRRPPKKRKRFEGYRAIIIKYNFQYEFNAKVTDHLATHPLKPYFRFEFQLSDERKERIKKDLIERALIDAKAKAEIIANSSKVKLKRIIKIRYGDQTITPTTDVTSVDEVVSMVRGTLTQLVDSPSIEYGETIVVTWEFE